jgi:hypothetical protein
VHATGIVVVGVEGHLFSVNLTESEFGDRGVDIDTVVYPTEVAGDASTGGVHEVELAAGFEGAVYSANFVVRVGRMLEYPHRVGVVGTWYGIWYGVTFRVLMDWLDWYGVTFVV